MNIKYGVLVLALVSIQSLAKDFYVFPQRGSHWLKSGIQATMIIQGINDEKVIDINDLQKALIT